MDEDGYRNAKVRGEMYEGDGDKEKKKKGKKKKEKEMKKRKKEKKGRKQMFESKTFGGDLAMKTKEEREARALEGEMEVRSKG